MTLGERVDRRCRIELGVPAAAAAVSAPAAYRRIQHDEQHAAATLECAYEGGCERTVADGTLYRTTPKGYPGRFMCEDHARQVGALR